MGDRDRKDDPAGNLTAYGPARARASASPSAEPVSFGEAPTLGPDEIGGILDDGRTDGLRRRKSGDSILGRYVVEKELGQGGMGLVYGCFDNLGGVRVAVKALPPELSHNSVEMEEVRENFRLVGNLRHPNIAGVRTLEQDGRGEYYLVMDVAEGESLRRWIRRKCVRRAEGRRGVPFGEAVGVLRQVASALDYAHAEHVVHRDVKPGNVMIDGRGRVKVLDFGLAAQIRTSLSRVSQAYRGTSGTGPYMAPEQWEAQPQNELTDQYALGVMAYEMLAGHLPFESGDMAVLRAAVLQGDVRDIPGVPRRAMRAIRRAMAKREGDRFGSCREFVEALDGGGGLAADGRRPGWRAWWIAAVLVVAAAGVGAGAVAVVKSRGGQVPGMSETWEAGPLAAVVDGAEGGEGFGAVVADGPEEEAWALEQAAAEGKRDGAEAARLAAQEAYGAGFGEFSDGEGARQGAESAFGRGDFAEAGRLWEQAGVDYNAAAQLARKAREVAEKMREEAGVARGRAVEVRGTGQAPYGEGEEKLAAAQNAFRAGNYVAAGEEWEAAARAYGAAAEGARRAREEAAARRGEARMAKLDAEEVNGTGRESYGEGERRRAAAEKAFGEGEYEVAAREWAGAAQSYGAAASISRRARDIAEKIRDNALAERKNAVGAKGTKLAAYAAGEQNRTAAEKAFAAGDYVAAGKGWKEAAKAYGEAAREAAPARSDPGQRAAGTEGILRLKGGEELRMVWCPAGRFTMGSPEWEHGRYGGEGAHAVQLTRGFWMGRTEVTRGQWRAVMEGGAGDSSDADLPVEGVSWEDAREFCRKAGKGLRLPTEAEWEYACRAGSTSAYFWGNGLNGERANCDGRYPCGPEGTPAGTYLGAAARVGSYGANAWGLYDMHGNASEWCEDGFGTFPAESTNPQNVSTDGNRVFRGGSWDDAAGMCRSACRMWGGKDDRESARAGHVGFRVCMDGAD